MQVPFQNAYYNNRRFPPPNNTQWRPNFAPRGPSSRFGAPAPHWKQHPSQEITNEFWCETCDRGFRTPDILEKHKQQHQKCNIDGCQFIAHPKVITKHIQMQHASGLYKKIAKLQDPEEIRKWREERKKRYPTKENVQKAAAAIKEKIERGEKMGLKSKRHDKSNKTDSALNGNKKSFNKRHSTVINDQNSAPDGKRRKTSRKPMVKKLPEVEDARKLRPFAGIQELIMDTDEAQDEPKCDFVIEDDDQLEDVIIPTEVTSGPVCLALSSLMCNYGSSDEDESNSATINVSCTSAAVNEPKERQAVTSNQATVIMQLPMTKSKERQDTSQIKNESDDDSGPEEVKVIKQISNESEQSIIKPFINRRKPKEKIPQKPIFKSYKHKLPSTLLQKLLFKEMKHERNVVLQCIRHIIRNNFFDKSV